jgi:hypothetical protein
MGAKDNRNTELDPNITLFERIKAYARGPKTFHFIATEPPFCDANTYVGTEDSSFHVETVFGVDSALREEMIQEFTDVPDEMRFPVAIIYWWSDDSNFLVNTPYGKLSPFAIGTDGNLHSFFEMYLINAHGEAFRLEEVQTFDDEELDFALANRGLTKNVVETLDFTPNDDHSRFVPLGPDDYKFIQSLLDDIDQGRMYLPIEVENIDIEMALWSFGQSNLFVGSEN